MLKLYRFFYKFLVTEIAFEAEGIYDITKLQLDCNNIFIIAEPVINNADMLRAVRRQRDRLLCYYQDRVDRYRNQYDACLPTTDSAEQIKKVLLYMQKLREFPETCDPKNPVWPTVPQE